MRPNARADYASPSSTTPQKRTTDQRLQNRAAIKRNGRQSCGWREIPVTIAVWCIQFPGAIAETEIARLFVDVRFADRNSMERSIQPSNKQSFTVESGFIRRVIRPQLGESSNQQPLCSLGGQSQGWVFFQRKPSTINRRRAGRLNLQMLP